MKKNLIHFAAAATLAAGMAFAQTAAPAAPQAPPNGPGTGTHGAMRGRMQGKRARLMQQLNLTDDQKAQAKTIFQRARQSAQPIVQQLRTNRQALSYAVKANDTARIQQLAATQGTLRSQVLVIRSEAKAKFYAMLTPDQRAKVDQWQQRRQERFQKRLNQPNNG